MEIITSRCLHYHFEFRNAEIIAIMKAIAELEHPKLKKEERLEIIKFIEENTDETTENLDLRTQAKIEQLYLYSKENWKDLSMPLLNMKNRSLVLLKQFIRESKSLAEAKQKFYEAGLGGERTFQRYNLKLKEATARQEN
jgi:DNA phosphorothioation-dependent restriction protein DptG